MFQSSLEVGTALQLVIPATHAAFPGRPASRDPAMFETRHLRACHELSEAVEVQLLQSWALFFSMTQGSSFLATLGYNI